LAGRYASALFDLAIDQKSLDTVESSLETLKAALAESDDFRQLIQSPLVSRDDAAKAVAAVGTSLGIDKTTNDFLGVLANNRRLGQLPAMIRAFEQLASDYRGEVKAEVTSAHSLDDAQVEQIKAQLKSRAGREIKISTKVDPDILGGLIVRMGSQMIDGSLRTRLNSLATAMKG
jgi:F-type H+-transporting ATPase subunit delta